MGPAGSILISVLCDAFTLAAGLFIAFMFSVLGFIPLGLSSVLCIAFSLAAGVFIAFMFLVLGFIPLAVAAVAFEVLAFIALAAIAMAFSALAAMVFGRRPRRWRWWWWWWVGGRQQSWLGPSLLVGETDSMLSGALLDLVRVILGDGGLG